MINSIKSKSFNLFYNIIIIIIISYKIIINESEFQDNNFLYLYIANLNKNNYCKKYYK